MIEVTILIPTFDNNLVNFSDETIQQWHSVLLDTFGGYSKQPQLTTGAWREGGVTYHDELVSYVVAIDGLADGEKVKRAVTEARSIFTQEAIYIKYLGLSEIL